MIGSLIAFVLAASMQLQEPAISLSLDLDREGYFINVETSEMYRMSAYCPCRKCCGRNAKGLTFMETVPKEGFTIAVDPNKIKLGTYVYFGGRNYRAEDTGSAIKGNRIDVFFDDHQDALEFGIQEMEVKSFWRIRLKKNKANQL